MRDKVKDLGVDFCFEEMGIFQKGGSVGEESLGREERGRGGGGGIWADNLR